MPLNNYGVSREDRAEVEVARKGWDDFFKKIEQENQHHYAPGSSLTNTTSSNPPGPSSSASRMTSLNLKGKGSHLLLKVTQINPNEKASELKEPVHLS